METSALGRLAGAVACVGWLAAAGAAAAATDDASEPPASLPAPPPPTDRSPAPAHAPSPPSPTAPAVSPAPPLVAPPAPTGPVPWPTISDQPASGTAAPPPAGAAGAPLAPVCPVCQSGGGPPAIAPAASPFAHTRIGALGEAQVFVDRDGNGTATLRRFVASIEHRPVDWLRIAGAVEVEDGTHGAMEQAYVALVPERFVALRAGLLLLPLGAINESRDPTRYLTVDRPLTDQLIIPTTWRELGVELGGEPVTGLRYQAQLVSGLDGSGFAAQAPLAGGRGNGRDVALHDVAVAGRLQLADYPQGLVLGGGGYYGGATGGLADLAGVRAGVVEADVSYSGYGLELSVEAAELLIVDSYRVNDYLGLLGQDAVPARGRGIYALAGYDLLAAADAHTAQALVVFAGYENVNPRSRMSPYNFNPPAITGPGQTPPEAPSPAKSFVRAGVDYRPRPSIALKADVQIALGAVGPAAAPPVTEAGATGTPKPLPADLALAARGETRFGFAASFNF